jgi:hypothetical protein
MFEDTRDYFNHLLDEAGIKYTVAPCFDGYQWRFPAFPLGDIICHSGSYHNNEGYVESYGFEWDEGDVTALPPEEMIDYLLGERTEHQQTYDIFDLFNSIAAIAEAEEEEE